LRESDDDFLISLETLDDVAFEKKGLASEILQLKHHVKHAANLTDASVDLWKTLRIWCEGYSNRTLPDDTIHYLVTTANASKTSAAYKLMADDRDVDSALKSLTATAQTSQNAVNKPAYAAFLALADAQRKALLERVFIFDSSPNIIEVFDRLKREVRWASASNHRDSLVQRLEGWWFRRVVNHLLGLRDPIPSQDIQAEIDDLREQFKEDNLPIDVLDLEIEHTAFLGQEFVHQLKLIDVTNPRIRIAIREYFRAFEQRSRWVREDLLHVGELEKYEQRLAEEWEILFEQMRDELGDDAAETQKKKAAQALYKWVESQANFPIRPRCNEAFVTRGTFHIMANGPSPRLGWHPDFVERIKQLLETGAGA
jgi:hypothetical protein